MRRVSVAKPVVPKRICVETAVRVLAFRHTFRRRLCLPGSVVREQGQLAPARCVACQARFRTGHEKDFVNASFRSAAVHRRFADGVRGVQQGRKEVCGESRKEARHGSRARVVKRSCHE